MWLNDVPTPPPTRSNEDLVKIGNCSDEVPQKKFNKRQAPPGGTFLKNGRRKRKNPERKKYLKKFKKYIYIYYKIF
jgi:hypothetical protein